MMSKKRSRSSRARHATYIRDQLVESVIDDMSNVDYSTARLDARDRVFEAFKCAFEFIRGKKRNTNTYIVGVGGRPTDLAAHVLKVCRVGFIEPEYVLGLLGGNISMFQARMVAEMIEFEFILEAVLEMISSDPPACEVWYDEDGYWNILPSSIDAHRAARQDRKRRRRDDVKYDKRSYHGRVRSQSLGRTNGHSSTGSPPRH